MKDEDIAKALGVREGELLAELRGLKARLLLDPTLSPEDRDARAQDASEAAEGSARVVKALGSVLRARQRLGEGVLGTCEGCQEPIPPARLVATGFSALRCVVCQEREDKRGTLAPRRGGIRSLYF